MMRIVKPTLRNSISALLSGQSRQQTPESLEPVRLAMLALLGKDGAAQNPILHRRLMYLHDAEALWYARSELMAILSQLHGEELAVAMVHDLTPLFRGLLPKGLKTASIRARGG